VKISNRVPRAAAIAIAVGLVSLPIAARAADAAPALAPAPAVAIFTLDGKPLSLTSFKGQVVLLDFWASWCAPCRASFPFLNKLQADQAADGLRIVGLTLEEDDDAITGFLDGVPAHFIIARDPSEKAGEAFGVVAMPTTFLIDREGRVAARFEGGDESVHDKIQAAVATLLVGGTLPPGTDVRVAASAEATGELKAWQRGYLADPIMNLDGDPLTRVIREHVHASKEGASGDGGAAGGGCGCN
jgi:cytochrome c biogenesis protein CcmG, thiol:disulfide interchange protein DsbE